VSAARAIAEIDTSADLSYVIPTLIAGLKNEKQAVSVHAIQGLELIGEPAVKSIQEVIGGPSHLASLNACDALAGIGPDAVPAVDKLVNAAKSPEASLRWHAISALGDIGPAAKASVPTLIAALEDSDPQVRFNAGYSLQQIGKPAVPALIESLKNEKLQKLVLPVIAEIGTDAQEAVAPLAGLIRSKNMEIRYEAVLALAAMGSSAMSTVPELVKMLEDKQFPNRPAAAYALGRIGAKDSVPALKSALSTTEDPVLRLATVWALVQIDPNNKEYETIALPLLTKALESDQAEIRREVAISLGLMGSRAKSAVPGLRLRLSDNDRSVRRESLVALAEIGPDSQSAVNEIIQILDEGDSNTRPIACYALGKIGTASKPAVPRLQKILQCRDSYEKTVAAWALVHIAPDPENVKVAIPLLAAALRASPNPKIRMEIAATLGKIGIGSPAAKEALQLALKDSNEDVKKAAESALGQLK
jgi:HEAT repeat protein